MPASLDSRVLIDPDVIFRELDGEAVILHLGTGLYYGLDSVGTRMWQLLAEHRSVRRVFDMLVEEFDVSPETLRADLLRLIDDLHDRKLVRLGPEEA